jgi:SAM-dependent methyltransferase
MTLDNEGVHCTLAQDCAICRSIGHLLYDGLRDRLFGAPGEWSLFRCSDPACGLVWSSPVPLPSEIGKLYRSYYTHSDTEPVGVQRSSRLKHALAIINFWRKPMFLTANIHLESLRLGRLLEIGCGNGALLAQAAKVGWSALGIDFDEAAVARANERDGVTAYVGELQRHAFADASFDAIVMNNVIEHIWNPVETMKECRRILNPSGRMIIVTPNIDCTGHRMFGRHWRGLEPPRHLFIYNVRSLKRLAKLCGFKRPLVFTSSGGSGGVAMLQASQEVVNRGLPLSRLRRIIRQETVASYLGFHIGEWCVAIC